MGETKFQKNLFTGLLCLGMVLGMTTFNVILQKGFSREAFNLLLREFGFVFIVAYVLDYYIICPYAKKKVCSWLKPDTKSSVIVIYITTTIVICMVLIMSAFGCLISKGITLNALKHYPKAVLLNFIVAIPLNLLIVLPVVRVIFNTIFPRQVSTRCS